MGSSTTTGTTTKRFAAAIIADVMLVTLVSLARPHGGLTANWCGATAMGAFGSLLCDLIGLAILRNVALIYCFRQRRAPSKKSSKNASDAAAAQEEAASDDAAAAAKLANTKWRSQVIECWSHASLAQLVYAIAKGVSRALGTYAARCDDDALGFDVACAVFAVFAYVTPAELERSLNNASSNEAEDEAGQNDDDDGNDVETARASDASVAHGYGAESGTSGAVALLSAPLLSSSSSSCRDTDDAASEAASSASTAGGYTALRPSSSTQRRKKQQEKETQWRSAASGIIKLTRPDAHLFALAMVCAVIAALATSAISLWTGDALDDLINHGDGRKFKRRVSQLAIIAAIGAVTTGSRGGLFSLIGVRINVRIREKLFNHLLTLELSFYDVTPTGDLNSRLSSDTSKIGDQVSLNVNVFARTGVQLITTLAFMVHTSPQLTLVACACVPVVGVVTKKYGEYVWSLSKAMQNKLASAMKVAEEAFSSMFTVRSMAGERAVSMDFSKSLKEYAKVGNEQAAAYSCWQSFNTGLPNFVTCLVLYYGGRLVSRGSLKSGRLVSFMLLTQSLADSFNTLADMYSNIADALGAADKVFDLLAKVPDRDAGAPMYPYGQSPPGGGGALGDTESTEISVVSPLHDPSSDDDVVGVRVVDGLHGRDSESSFGKNVVRGLVELEDVHFRYPSRPDVRVLRGVTLAAEPGSVVALVGPSGSGKSSILALVQRFYAPDRGLVKIDGEDVARIPHRRLHRIVALVGQNPVLFARSIKANVAYALDDDDADDDDRGKRNPKPSDADVERVLKMAHAWDFVDGLPNRLDTDVGERGVALSGGQAQRIAIARALARKPNILLLDEATSALDAESEHKVQAALDELIKASNMTVIVVAHRLSTIKGADSISCMRDGVIIEQGTHDALMATPRSVYADLVRRQAALAEKDAATS